MEKFRTEAKRASRDELGARRFQVLQNSSERIHSGSRLTETQTSLSVRGSHSAWGSLL